MAPNARSNRRAINAIRKALVQPDDMFQDDTMLRINFPDGSIERLFHKNDNDEWVEIDLVEFAVEAVEFDRVMAEIRAGSRRVQIAHLWKPLIHADADEDEDVDEDEGDEGDDEDEKPGKPSK